MADTYTFFLKLFSWRVAMYEGELAKRPEGAAANPAYAIHMHMRRFEMTKRDGPSQAPCLEGRFEGFTQRRASIWGNGVMSTARMPSYQKDVSWSFVHNADEYTWYAQVFEKTWELTGADGEIIAVFDRGVMALRRMGVLRFTRRIEDETFRSLAIAVALFVARSVSAVEGAAVS
ncbi:hypothetical protein H4R19_005473 [Coemansia spiralis]|nr:hypothetical protein H4R19_005473 [Coemansia spiralis]